MQDRVRIRCLVEFGVAPNSGSAVADVALLQTKEFASLGSGSSGLIVGPQSPVASWAAGATL